MYKIKENLVLNHVYRRGRKGWAVRKSSAARAARVFQTQAEAVAYGAMLSNLHNIPLIVHNTHGTVESIINSDAIWER